ncbi:MAG: hypothetical protein JW702_05815 [Clostridiales bacterium]|nr:hypothetical protein [Clostridiales bacterium]
MNKGWTIAFTVILIIVASIGSAYLMRSVGELSIEIDELKMILNNQNDSVENQIEIIAKLEEDNKNLIANMELLLSDNIQLNEKMDFLKEKFIELPGVVNKFGVIEKMTVGNGRIQFEIDQKQWLTGEEGMRYLIETYDLEISQAADLMPNGYYIKDIPDDGKVYELTKEAIIKIISENVLVDSDLASLIEHVKSNDEVNNYPLFDFYVIENNTVEVTEKYIP